MLLPLCFVLAGCFCSSVVDPPQQTVLQGTEATLLCPDEKPGVTWRRLINGKKVDLLTVQNGIETTKDKRYGSRVPTSLVIRNVTSWDSAMYFCNGKIVYLNVTEGVGPDAGHEGRTPAPGGPGPRGTAGDAERSPPRRGRGPVGMVVGAALVVLGVLTLNFCYRNRTEKSTKMHEAEVIYEEINVGVESYFESPHHVTRFGEMAHKLLTGGQECVYSLAQSPLSTGSESVKDACHLSH